MNIRSIFLAVIMLCSISASFGQTTYSAKVNPNNLAPLSTQKKVLPPPQLPDLKFTELKVTATPVQDNGTTKYNISYSYTVTNAGTVAVLTDSISIQDYYTNESNYPKVQDLHFTAYFQEAGGRILSNAFGRGETLAPGATNVVTGTRFNVSLPSSPKPIYLVVIDPFGGPKESDATNNRAYTPILL